jgi:hypothetical protein
MGVAYSLLIMGREQVGSANRKELQDVEWQGSQRWKVNSERERTW